MLREITADQDNIEVSSFEGLLVDFVKEQHADAIVRGLRTPGDFEYELPLAQANHKLSVQADISGYVPETVLRYMREHGVVSN